MKIDNLCKICRREGVKLFLKGEKCLSPRCPLVRRSYPPGQHGMAHKKLSDYAKQLREKQKAKRIYGVSEIQFKNYYKKASRSRAETDQRLLSLLERRLDNLVYRLGLAFSRREARQLTSHGHFLVNQKKVNIPSYLVKAKDKIEINKKSQNLPIFKKRKRLLKEVVLPSWLKLDQTKMKGEVLHLPKREEIETNIDPTQIIEFYSK